MTEGATPSGSTGGYHVCTWAGVRSGFSLSKARTRLARTSLGTRVGLVTASNEHQESRPTGSLPLLQKIITGVVIIVLLLFLKAVLVFALVFPPSGGKSFQVLAAGVASVCFGCGCTLRPIAQTNPANSRASAAAATGDFLRAMPVRCL